MSQAAVKAGALTPIENMRITFWGVQGSCPIFPSPREVNEYARRVAVHTLAKTLEDMAGKADEGRCSIKELLGMPMSLEAVEQYQLQIGLPALPVFGGDTTCIEVETSDGDVLVFDAGSGIRQFSQHRIQRWDNRPDRTIHLFGSHEHLDHRNGFPFANFCFVQPNPFHLNVYGPRQFLVALDQRCAIFSRRIDDETHRDDPIDFRIMAATFEGVELRRPDAPPPADDQPPWTLRDMNDPIRIGEHTIVEPFDVYHAGTRCLAYRVRHNSASFVFCTDHELRHGDDPQHPHQVESLAAEQRVLDMCAVADVAYFDAQFFLSEYLGLKPIGASPPVSRIDWGHSCIEDVIERAVKCDIKHTLIGHHDPAREWPERVDVNQQLLATGKSKGRRIELAKSDTSIDI